MAHAKARLTPAGRLLLVDRIVREGWPPAHAAAMQGVSRATAYKWLRRFRDEGVDGMQDRSSRPHRCPHRTTPDAEAAVIAARLKLRQGPHRIADALGMPASTVHAVLRRVGLSRLSTLDRSTGVPVRYVRERPGELVHVDVKKLGRIPEGGGWKVHGRELGRTKQRRRTPIGFDYLHVAVDDASRVAFVQAHPDERAPTCAAFMADAVRFFAGLGVTVERVMTDNAFAYVHGRQFADVLAANGISHKRTRPYRPQTNGKAERFNRTLLEEWAYKQPYATNRDRLDALQGFIDDYNSRRTHRSLGRPPMAIVNDEPGTNS